MSIVLISIDVSKAFDSIDHEILLGKMKNMGIGIKAIELTRNYLSHRHQFVKIGNSFSQTGQINKRITQGSILGSKFFSIYVTVIKYLQTHSKILKFADDIVLMMEVDQSDDKLSPVEMIKKDVRLLRNFFGKK